MAASDMVPAIGGAPLGLTSLDDIALDDSPAIEIEIEDPEGLRVGIDGVEIDLMPGTEMDEGIAFDANLAEHLSEGELQKIASELTELIEADITSRKDWVETYVKGLEVLGMKYEERTEPWTGACGVFSTLLTEAAVRFQSETIIETFPAAGPVKTEIVGAVDRLKEEAANRVRDDMNWRLTEQMPEYRTEHERMLFNLGLAGCAFKKVYFDTSKDRQVAMFIPAEDIILPYGCSGVRNAERATHLMRKTENDIKRLQVAGFYREVDLGEPQSFFSDIEKKKAEDQGYTLTEDNRYQLFETAVEFDLPGFESEDGIALPYIITIDRGTNNVLSIYRNWREDDERKQKRDHFVQYDYVTGFGAYGIGYIHLIGGYARAGTSIIRQLVDAGTLSNLPGGLKTRGLRIKGDDTPIQPGEFRDVDIPSGAVRDNIMPLPYKEPSQVLAGLLDKITLEARRLGSIADMQVSDMSANSPVGTTLALLERQLKTMSAVQARVHYSMKQEFKLLKEIIRENTPAEYAYTPVKGDRQTKQADYDMVDVIPVSDPNSATMAQRIMQYQAIIQLAQGAPQIYDLPQLHRQMIEVLGVKNAEKLVPIDEDMKPRDPISENMSFLTGKPAKAFLTQDHDAHIATHMSMLQDPMVMGQLGQTPMAQQIQAAIMAHIAEHVAFQYRAQVQERLGATLPAPDQQLPELVEVELSKLVAQASQQLMTIHKGQAAQQQAQQQMQDPIIQMQQQELQIKAQEAQIKAQKVQGDLAIKQAELQLKAQEAGKQEDPAMLAQRHQQEMMAMQQKHEQEMAAARQRMTMEAQQHQQNMYTKSQEQQLGLTYKQKEHQQKLDQQRALAAAKIEQMKNQPKPTAKPSGRKGD